MLQTLLDELTLLKGEINKPTDAKKQLEALGAFMGTAKLIAKLHRDLKIDLGQWRTNVIHNNNDKLGEVIEDTLCEMNKLYKYKDEPDQPDFALSDSS
jgi:hypothetical protein